MIGDKVSEERLQHLANRPYLQQSEVSEMAQELLTLRRESERLRKRVEVLKAVALDANSIQVNHLKICYQDMKQCFCGLDDLSHSIKKWRESEERE